MKTQSQRQIKFRVWSDTLKQFFTPQWISADGLQLLYLHSGNQIEIVNNPKIQQFTGLYDKNKKEIFEGDIINLYDFNVSIFKSCYEVIFNRGSFCFKQDTRSIGSWALELEIIGNILQNKDLLN